MRPNMTSDVLSAIAAPVITTALLARFDFQSGPAFLWTGIHAIQPMGSGDTLLEGNVFEPLAEGVLVDIGENTFAQNGSSELQINLAVPASINTSLGSGLVDHSQKITVAARAMAEKKVVGSGPIDVSVFI